MLWLFNRMPSKNLVLSWLLAIYCWNGLHATTIYSLNCFDSCFTASCTTLVANSSAKNSLVRSFSCQLARERPLPESPLPESPLPERALAERPLPAYFAASQKCDSYSLDNTIARRTPIALLSADATSKPSCYNVGASNNQYSPAPTAATPNAPNSPLAATAAPVQTVGSMITSAPLGFQADGTPSLVMQAIALSALALLPFLIMLLTPFAKFVMVFSLLRNALGVQQVPPNQVINGISLILSIFVIFPVGLKMYKIAQPIIATEAPASMMDQKAPDFIVKIATLSKEPLREFLIKNTLLSHQKNFYKIAFKMLPDDLKEYVNIDNFIVVIPAYITSQIKHGFEIGVLIYLPFFVIDLVVSNILLAMGMMMLSPVTISMPLKIFLLVMLDGWTLLTQGLILSYRV